MFVMKVLLKAAKDCNKECYVFLALVDVIELIVASSRTSVPPEKLLTAVEQFLHLFKDAWGCGWMTPKFHWLLHFWQQLSKYGKMLSCFCL